MWSSSKLLLLAFAVAAALSCRGGSSATVGSGGGPGPATGGQDAGGGGPAAGGSPSGDAGAAGTAAGGAGAGVAGADGGAVPAVSCANIDATLPPEPVIPAACATLQAALESTPGTPPSEANLDTTRIQAALSSCAAGQAVKLTTDGANNAFVTGPLNVPTGVSLWIDAGTTLFGSRDPPSMDRPRPSLACTASGRAFTAKGR